MCGAARVLLIVPPHTYGGGMCGGFELFTLLPLRRQTFDIFIIGRMRANTWDIDRGAAGRHFSTLVVADFHNGI